MTESAEVPVGPTAAVAVSMKRILDCLHSAHFWVNALPEYADCNQLKADFWSITAGVFAAITSLSVFPALGPDSRTWVKVLVSAIALASAVAALVPRVKNYGEQAGTARVLAAQYGSIYGVLEDVVADQGRNQAAARAAVNQFNSIKEKKDALRSLTPWSRLRDQHRLLHEQGKHDEAAGLRRARYRLCGGAALRGGRGTNRGTRSTTS
jgi:hypothetical protein